MKIVCILLCFGMLPGLAASNDVQSRVVKHQIDEVTVFQQQAQVFHSGSQKLSVGVHKLVFEKISPYADPNTLQINGKGDGEMTVIKMIQDFDKQGQQTKEYLQLKDSLLEQQETLREFNDRLDVLQKEEQLLMANMKPGSEKSTFSTEELQKFSQFFRNRLTEIKQSQRQLQEKQKKQQERVQMLEATLNQLASETSQPYLEIEVELQVRTDGVFQFRFNYMVSSAGWQPSYDIRINPTEKEASLISKARITQQTGVDWKDVKLTLSTRRPSSSSQMPDPQPWYVNVYQPQVFRQDLKRKSKVAAPEMAGAPAREAEESFSADMEVSLPSVVMEETALSIEYSISGKRTLFSQPTQEQLDINRFELPYLKRYLCMPKYSEQVYLTALIMGWEKLNLLPGQANVFFEGTFTGKTYIKPSITSDTLVISLGSDPQMICLRIEQNKTGVKMLGTQVKVSRSYQVTLKNVRNFEADILLIEQYPISQHENIQVELTQWDGAELKKESGTLEWKIKLEPTKSVSKSYSFEVKYPKDMIVSGL